MTLTLEIPPRVFGNIERAAKKQGVLVEMFAVSVLEQFVLNDEAARLAAVDRLRGRFPSSRTVDDFLAERHAEGEADYLAGLERQKAREQKS